MKGIRVLVALVLGVCVVPVSMADTIESVNADADPNEAAVWGVYEVGWRYVAGSTYDLTGILTKFGGSDGRTMNVNVYDESPLDGGNLLRTASFVALANEFTGGTFAALRVTAGEDYFISVSNVDFSRTTLAISANNATKDAGRTLLSDLFVRDFADEPARGPYNFTDFSMSPILKFEGTAVTPLPAAAAGGLALIGCLGVRRGGRKARA